MTMKGMILSRRSTGIGVLFLIVSVSIAGCETRQSGSPTDEIPESTPEFSNSEDAAEHLARNGTYRGTWSWTTQYQTRRGETVLRDLEAVGSSVSGKIIIERSAQEGGGIDKFEFSEARIFKKQGMWTMKFRGKISEDLPVGDFVFRIAEPNILKGYSTGVDPNVKYYLAAERKREG